MYYCNGMIWKQSNLPPLGSSSVSPASSCAQIVTSGDYVANSSYYIKLANGAIILQVCEQSFNKGGDGSTADKTSYSCATLKLYFGVSVGFAFIDATSSPPDPAKAIYTSCYNGISEGESLRTRCTC